MIFKEYKKRSMYLINPHTGNKNSPIVTSGLLYYFNMESAFDFDKKTYFNIYNSDISRNNNKCHYNNSILSVTPNLNDLPAGNSSRTISFWVKLNSYPLNTLCSFLALGDNISYGFFSIGCNPNGNLFFWGSSYNKTSNLIISKNVWTHIVCTYNGNELYFFINGVKDNVGLLPLINTASNYPIKIGYRNVYSYFDGYIDDIYIYNRVLSNNEINMLMNQ